MGLFERIVRLLSKFCDHIAQAGVILMFLLLVSNILLRIVWKPIYGAYDYVCFAAVIIIAFAIPYCALQKGHIQLELLMERFPQRIQGIIGSITGILSLGIFSLLTWQCIVLANDMRRAGELSMTSLVPFYPYIYALAFGCTLLCFVILLDLIMSVVKAVKG